MAALHNVEVGTRVLPLDGTVLGWMNEAPTEAGSVAAEIRREMLTRDGYLLLRGAVPRELVDAGCASITAEVARQGWLVEGTDPSELIVKKTPPGSGMLRPEESDVLMNDAAVRRVLHGPELHGIFAELFGEPAVSLDYKWFRAVVPEQYSGFHMDNVYMGAGSSNLHTVWLPWHDVSVARGGLVMLEGSSSLNAYKQMRDTYGEQQHGQWFGLDPAELLAFDADSPAEVGRQKARWVTAEFKAGDIVVFPMKIMHGSLTNKTDRLRFSCDVRFQPSSEPVDPRYTAHGGVWKRGDAAENRSGKEIDLGYVSPSVRRSMAEAKEDWGLVRTPRGDFPLTPAAAAPKL